MADRDAFVLGRSNLNSFLFASIGVERSGMPLSVNSAMARLGLDPWQEAARLATLPQTASTEWLARFIAAMPAGLWPMADATTIAARLVALLPGEPDRPGLDDVQARVNWRWLLIAAMAVVMGISLLGQPAPMPPVTHQTAIAAGVR